MRHPQLIRFRNVLREVISTAELVEEDKLLNESKGLKPTESIADLEKRKILSDKQDKLAAAWDKSLCICSLCGSRTSDMTFNAYIEGWFCVKCYEEHQEFYEDKAIEGEIWHDETVSRTPSTEWWP